MEYSNMGCNLLGHVYSPNAAEIALEGHVESGRGLCRQQGACCLFTTAHLSYMASPG